MMSKTYSEAIALSSFEERFRYLKMQGIVGDQTFAGNRYLNQLLYRSKEWKQVRRNVVIRDNGCDLADPDRPIFGRVLIHHINPITIEDIRERSNKVLSMENLICVSFETHNALHYGNESVLQEPYVERQPYDTCPWR